MKRGLPPQVSDISARCCIRSGETGQPELESIGDNTSCHCSNRFSKSRQRRNEQQRSDNGQCQKLRPDYGNAGATEENGFRQGNEMRCRRSKHEEIHSCRHAFTRRHAPDSMFMGRRTIISRRPNWGIVRAKVARKMPRDVVANTWRAAAARNSGIEHSIGTESNVWIMKINDKSVETTTTTPIDHTLLIMIS